MPGPAGNGRRVLIVDDERVIADTLAVIFSQVGYVARATYTAEEAVEVMRTWPADLAIVDVVLPRMNGIDCANLLRAEHPSCRVLLFSGQAATADLLETARESGHTFDVLAKPVHPEDMLSVAARMLTGAAEA